MYDTFTELGVKPEILKAVEDMGLPIHALPIYGGQDIERQFKALRKHPNIIVATPGRLMDHMKRGTIDLSHVQILVLDEGDEMVDMGFIDDIRTILAGIPEERQTMFFSATMPAPIRELAETFLKEPEIVKIKAATVTIDLIEQEYIELPDRQKFDALCRLLDMQDPDRSPSVQGKHHRYSGSDRRRCPWS